jgi:hypothetical protein
MDSTCVTFNTTLVCQDPRALLSFVNEMHGKLCMYINYRVLNKITIKNHYPLPQINDIF